MTDAAHETDSALMHSSPELVEVSNRARRRRRWRLLPAVVGGLAAGVIAGALGSHRHATHHHHHAGGAGVAIALSLVAVLLVAEVAFFFWLSRKHKGSFGPQPMLGLPYRERKSVLRAVRRGEPPADRTLAVVGYVTARRMVRFRTASLVAMIIVGVAELVNAALPDRASGLRLFYLACAVIFAGLVWWQLRILRGAEAYVHKFEESPRDQQP